MRTILTIILLIFLPIIIIPVLTIFAGAVAFEWLYKTLWDDKPETYYINKDNK